MKQAWVVLIFLLVTSSCEDRPIRHSGITDHLAGSHQVVLYEDGQFYLSLSSKGAEGTYQLKHDTVYLVYKNKPRHWPYRLLLTEDYFITINADTLARTIRIKREK